MVKLFIKIQVQSVMTNKHILRCYRCRKSQVPTLIKYSYQCFQVNNNSWALLLDVLSDPQTILYVHINYSLKYFYLKKNSIWIFREKEFTNNTFLIK